MVISFERRHRILVTSPGLRRRMAAPQPPHQEPRGIADLRPLQPSLTTVCWCLLRLFVLSPVRLWRPGAGSEPPQETDKGWTFKCRRHLNPLRDHTHEWGCLCFAEKVLASQRCRRLGCQNGSAGEPSCQPSTASDNCRNRPTSDHRQLWRHRQPDRPRWSQVPLHRFR